MGTIRPFLKNREIYSAMNTFISEMKNYLRGWNFMRILRLALAVFIIIQGVQYLDWSYILLGALFGLLPIFNIGCCAAGNCGVPARRENNYSTEDTTFDEIK
jgi:hypothetical protein